MMAEMKREEAHAPVAALNLTLLLAMQVAMQPLRSFLAAPDGRHWSFQEAEAAAAHLGWLLRQLGVKTGDRVALMAPNGHRAVISLAGLLRGGMQPVLISPLLSFAEATAATTASQPVAIIAAEPTSGGDTLETAARLAAASGSVRFVLGFGATMPRGVMDLGARFERARANLDSPRDDDTSEPQTLLIARADGEIDTIRIEPLLAASVEIAGAAGLRSSDRIVCPLPLEDPAGIAAGLFAALFAGAELAALDAPAAAALVDAFDTERDLHVIWPAPLGDLLSELAGGAALRSLIRRRQRLNERGDVAPRNLSVEHLVDIAPQPGGGLAIETIEAA